MARPATPRAAGAARPLEEPRTARELRLARAGRKRSAPKPAGNPLREGLRLERMPDPAIVVLFGGTGDLAHRKVVPALFHRPFSRASRSCARPAGARRLPQSS